MTPLPKVTAVAVVGWAAVEVAPLGISVVGIMAAVALSGISVAGITAAVALLGTSVAGITAVALSGISVAGITAAPLDITVAGATSAEHRRPFVRLRYRV